MIMILFIFFLPHLRLSKQDITLAMDWPKVLVALGP